MAMTEDTKSIYPAKLSKRSLLSGLAGFGVLWLGGCVSSTGKTDLAQGDAVSGFDPWTIDDYVYQIGSGDELALNFILAPELNGTVTISPDGSAAFPLIGSQYLLGLSVDQARGQLLQAYAAALRNPQLDMRIATYGAAQVFIGGEVKEPGAKPIKGQLTIAQAVMMAGGYSDTARSGEIVVLRQGPNDVRPHLRVVNLNKALRGDDVALRVRPGDVVFVPRSHIAEVNLFVRQYITNLIPFGFSLGINR
jgi:protein involved in polysaccharide export with SLBB domain